MSEEIEEVSNRMKTSDKTVVHNLGLEACGGGANMVAADVKDGKLVRIRPMSFENDYTKEELNYWVLEGRGGKTFEPGMKTPTPPFPRRSGCAAWNRT